MARKKDDRPTKQARLTPAANAAWERLLVRRGVRFTTLMEALGEMLADPTHPDHGWVPEAAIRRARELDRERYSRHD